MALPVPQMWDRLPMSNNVLIHGDCREELLNIANESVDAVVTDPPYELGFMGKSWDSTGIAYDSDVWAQIWRVLKPGGHLLAFGGSRTYHRMACAIEDAGFEIRDQIMWIYATGFPKSKNLDGDWKGWGTALKPSHEPIVMARKPLQGTVTANVAEYGTGALNIEGCRVGATGGSRNTSPGGSRNGWGMNVQWGERIDGLGRWPANLIHDGSDEVVALFPDSKGGAYPARRGIAVNTTFASGQETEGGARQMGDDGSASRYFYCAKANKRDRNDGLDGFEIKKADTRTPTAAGLWENMNAPQANNHPTVKPTDLMRYLVRLVTPPGGVVLDPFMGSGSTGKAAALEGFRFVGIEQDAEYVEIARARIAAVSAE